MNIIFCTSNQNKLREIADTLGSSVQLQTPADFGITEDIPEPFETFQENALAKAEYVYKRLKMNVFADDSGLVVEALGGAPGVYSARFAARNNFDGGNTEYLLQKLREQGENRKAYFVTSIALILNGKQHFFQGRVVGTLLEEERGTKGFGYDPIFVPEGHNRTFAEMSLQEKGKISHRAKAVHNLQKFLTF